MTADHVRVAIVFLLLGLTLVYYGVVNGLPGAPMTWGGISCVIVVGCYLGLGPGPLGKRRDGTMNIISLVALYPYFFFTWGVWYIWRALSTEPRCHEIAPGLFVGRRPLHGEIPEGVTLVVDLTSEFRSIRDVREAFAYRCLPTLDLVAPPSAEEFTALATEIAEWKAGGVYIHCAKGHGRSAMLMGAVLIKKGIVDNVEAAIKTMQSVRPGIRLRAAQRRILSGLPAAVSDDS